MVMVAILDLDSLNKLLFPHSEEAPHEICLQPGPMVSEEKMSTDRQMTNDDKRAYPYNKPTSKPKAQVS